MYSSTKAVKNYDRLDEARRMTWKSSNSSLMIRSSPRPCASLTAAGNHLAKVSGWNIRCRRRRVFAHRRATRGSESSTKRSNRLPNGANRDVSSACAPPPFTSADPSLPAFPVFAVFAASATASAWAHTNCQRDQGVRAVQCRVCARACVCRRESRCGVCEFASR